MSHYVRLNAENVVVELFETDGDISQMFHPSIVWVAVGADVKVGDVRGGDGAFSTPAPAAPDLVGYAAAVRYAKEIGGITVGGAPVDTSRESQSMIANAVAFLDASGGTSVAYKTPAGFVTLTAEQVRAIALAVGGHVQACFAKEAEIAAGLAASPPTISTEAAIGAAFAAITTAH